MNVSKLTRLRRLFTRRTCVTPAPFNFIRNTNTCYAAKVATKVIPQPRSPSLLDMSRLQYRSRCCQQTRMIVKYFFKRHLKKRVVLLLFVCILFTVSYLLYTTLLKSNKESQRSVGVNKWNQDKSHEDEKVIPMKADENFSDTFKKEDKKLKSDDIPLRVIDIWSIVGLGDYTWQHILGGPINEDLKSTAEFRLKKTLLRYHTDAVSWESIPQNTKNLMLVLNGRAFDKVQYAKMWLDSLNTFPVLGTAILMIIGGEDCDNDWLLPYLKSNGGRLSRVFISYDTTVVDNREVIQWPLGAATYRGFPLEDSKKLLAEDSRQYRCNFLGTVYPGSSREQLVDILERNNLADYCYIKARKQWDAEESKDSMEEYVRVLQQSDLTLSPVGQNIECYRIYEAAALGSVPVIEDVRTSPQCSSDTLRVVKQMNAPFIYVKDWSELPNILREELKKTPEMIVERRINLIKWYQMFKMELRKLFIDQLEATLETEF